MESRRRHERKRRDGVVEGVMEQKCEDARESVVVELDGEASDVSSFVDCK